jgi:hypothetical protein
MTFTVALCHGGMGCLFMEHADFSSPFVTSVVSRDAWEERKFVCIVSSVTSMVLGMTVEFPIPCFPMPTNKNCRGISTGLMISLIEGSTAFFHSNGAFGDSTVNTLEDPAVYQKLKVSSMEPMFDLALLSNWGLWLASVYCRPKVQLAR